jgi:hypothetical protein
VSFGVIPMPPGKGTGPAAAASMTGYKGWRIPQM